LTPPAPDPFLSRGAPYVQVARGLSENEVDAANSAEACPPLPMRFFIREEVLQLGIGKAEFQVVIEWRKATTGLLDLENGLVGRKFSSDMGVVLTCART